MFKNVIAFFLKFFVKFAFVVSALTICLCSRVPYFGIVVGLIILLCRDILLVRKFIVFFFHVDYVGR
jgi:hypothetical protein